MVNRSADEYDNGVVIHLLKSVLGEVSPAQKEASAELARCLNGAAARRGIPPHEREDISQTILVKVLRDKKMRGFLESDAGRAAARFWTMADHVCIDYFRERKMMSSRGTHLVFSPDDADCLEDADARPVDFRAIEVEKLDPMGANDLELVCAWSLRIRMVLLPMTGLWRLIPGELWAIWVDEADLEKPFPPMNYRKERCQTARDKIHCRMLGIEPNTLVQIRCRGKDLIAQLECAHRFLS